jgi:hypothetical protein
MKKCSQCGKVKRLGDFGVRAASVDGRTAACLECLRIRDKARYPKERGVRLERMRVYAAGEGKDKCNAAKKRWQASNQDKRAAHVILNNALRSGKVKRQPCEVCGDIKAEAHHDDYSKPLDVRWLCDRDHKAHHHQ